MKKLVIAFLIGIEAFVTVAAMDPLDMRWTFGAHEPITMYRRKGVKTTGGIEGSSKWTDEWLNWFDTESPKLMKELGLNWCHARFYKGMGWEFEKKDYPNVRRFVDAAHANGVHVLAYIQFMTLYYENMLAEIPELATWAAKDYEGRFRCYHGNSYYRWLPCISCDEWVDYLIPIMKFAVTEGGFDGVMFDNATSKICYCERCKRKFREHLAKLPDLEQRFGFTDMRFVQPPPESVLKGEIKDALAQELIFWRSRMISDIFAKFHRELKKANPNAILSANVFEPRCADRMRTECVDIPQMIANLDFMVAQSGNYPEYDAANDRLRTRFRLLKTLRTLGMPNVALCDNDSNMTPEQEKYYLLPLLEDVLLGGVPTDRTVVSPGADCFYDKHKLERRRPLLGLFNTFVRNERGMLASRPYEPVKLLFPVQSTILSDRCHRGLGVAEEICLRRHVPFGYIISNPDALIIPEDTEVLVVSDQTCLSEAQCDSLVTWAKKGGKLVVTGDSGRCDELNRQYQTNPLKPRLAGLANVVWRDASDTFSGRFSISWAHNISAPSDNGDRLVADLAKVGFRMPYELRNVPPWVLTEVKRTQDGYAVNCLNFNPSTPLPEIEVLAPGRVVRKPTAIEEDTASRSLYRLFDVAGQ